MPEKILNYKCRCGGTLKKSHCPVEFFGIDFGIRECEVCSKCSAEYLSEEVLAEIEKEVKKRQLFGLEQKVRVTKSGNSLVIRVPPEIARYSNLKYESILRLVPVSKKKIEIEVTG